jgi:tRNA-specific 2-thiouridylase
MRSRVLTEPFHWLAPMPDPTQPLWARLRHRQALAPCQLRRLPDDGAEVLFDQPQRAVTPGQFLVLYDGERCLGCGEIRR